MALSPAHAQGAGSGFAHADLLTVYASVTGPLDCQNVYLLFHLPCWWVLKYIHRILPEKDVWEFKCFCKNSVMLDSKRFSKCVWEVQFLASGVEGEGIARGRGGAQELGVWLLGFGWQKKGAAVCWAKWSSPECSYSLIALKGCLK